MIGDSRVHNGDDEVSCAEVYRMNGAVGDAASIAEDQVSDDKTFETMRLTR